MYVIFFNNVHIFIYKYNLWVKEKKLYICVYSYTKELLSSKKNRANVIIHSITRISRYIYEGNVLKDVLDLGLGNLHALCFCHKSRDLQVTRYKKKIMLLHLLRETQAL